ncbi:MAG: bacterial transcriptional activator domain-containing protein, partial [Chloroflexota bacterium]
RATQSPMLKLERFGPFKVWRDGELIGHWPNPKVEVLLKILVARQVRDGAAMSARDLVAMLWEKPGVEEYRGLMPLINEARLMLEPNIDPRQSSFVLRSSTGFSLDFGSNVVWDLRSFRDCKKEGDYLIETQQWAKALPMLEKARSLYKDDFLAEDDSVSWAVELRRLLTKEYTAVLASLADVYAAQERYNEGINVCSEALVHDPLVESVYRRLMRFYYWQGKKDEALKTYRMCVKLFEDLFGESPKPITRQLYEAIQQDEKIVNILL